MFFGTGSLFLQNRNHFKVLKLHWFKASTKEKIFRFGKINLYNDPSAGSPTEQLRYSFHDRTDIHLSVQSHADTYP
jgi:hypothetical protein